MACAYSQRAAPRFELWNLRLPDAVRQVRFVQFGIQAQSEAAAGDAAAELQALLALGDAPAELSRGVFVDVLGVTNLCWLAYWFDPAAYERWSGQVAVQDYWASRPAHGPLGYWRESAAVPVDNIDTLYTPHDPFKYEQAGVARHGTMEVCQLHDYWGAVRDRMPAAAEGGLSVETGSYTPAAGETLGQRIRLTAPANVCMARHHEDWRNSPAFGELYQAKVKGVKEAGTRHLASHPELGCITARELAGQALDGKAIGRADAIAWFLSLDHLLDWARSDPSHQAIYTAFFNAATAVKDGQVWDVPMWHEVFVVPQGGVEAEYVNCNNRTGFLGLLEQRGLVREAVAA
jgi:hypothetical protein